MVGSKGPTIPSTILGCMTGTDSLQGLGLLFKWGMAYFLFKIFSFNPQNPANISNLVFLDLCHREWRRCLKIPFWNFSQNPWSGRILLKVDLFINRCLLAFNYTDLRACEEINNQLIQQVEEKLQCSWPNFRTEQMWPFNSKGPFKLSIRKRNL